MGEISSRRVKGGRGESGRKVRVVQVHAIKKRPLDYDFMSQTISMKRISKALRELNVFRSLPVYPVFEVGCTKNRIKETNRTIITATNLVGEQ